jgi:hypothetical protein
VAGQLCIFSAQLRLARERPAEVAALQRDCFDAKPILQDPTNEALELT